MTPEEHLKAGDPGGALSALQEQIRSDPSNAKLRIFLFQLLCVLGDWKRAVTQLKLSAEMDPAALLMAQAYREAILCEVYREKVFAGTKDPLVLGEPEEWLAHLIEAQKLQAQGNIEEAATLRELAFEAAPAVSGTVNDIPFDWIADADMRLGPVLEVILNGRYFWLPFSQVRSLELDPPSDLRDSVWMAGVLTLANGGEMAVLLPTRYPNSTEADGEAMLGRITAWEEVRAGTFIGIGQRLFAIGNDDIALMDVRSLVLDTQADDDTRTGDADG